MRGSLYDEGISDLVLVPDWAMGEGTVYMYRAVRDLAEDSEGSEMHDIGPQIG